MKSCQRAFTLIELIVVVGLLTVLLSISLVAINPQKQFSDANDTQRRSNVKAILDAINEYQVDHAGQLPTGINTNLHIIGTSTSNDCSIECGSSTSSSSPSSPTAGTLEYINNSQFDNGIYSDTEYFPGEEGIGLVSGVTTGSYTSDIYDNSFETTWENFSWVPKAPYNKPLPDNGVVETSYISGNFDMTNNQVLFHMNESNGNLSDSSGNGYIGTATDLSYGTEGVFENSISFNGSSSNIVIPHDASQVCTTGCTFMAWVKTNANETMQIAQKGGWNGHGIYQDRWNGWKVAIRIWGGTPNLNWGQGIPTFGRWYHIAGVYRDGSLYLYVDGQEVASQYVSGTLDSNSSDIMIGSSGSQKYFNGDIDEFAYFTRGLSAIEVEDAYKRGALKMDFELRSCDDSECSGESFTEYSDGVSIDDNQYFQFRVNMNTFDSIYTPILDDVSINYSTEGSGTTLSEGETTESSCLDLEPFLVPTYLAEMPVDPTNGSQENTGYGVKLNSNNRVEVYSCSNTNTSLIKVVR